MRDAEIDDDLNGLEEPKRSTPAELRRSILELVPDAEQGLSNEPPAFRVEGRSALHFPVDRPLPKRLVEKLVAARLGED